MDSATLRPGTAIGGKPSLANFAVKALDCKGREDELENLWSQLIIRPLSDVIQNSPLLNSPSIFTLR
jgi:hypothetical protein